MKNGVKKLIGTLSFCLLGLCTFSQITAITSYTHDHGLHNLSVRNIPVTPGPELLAVALHAASEYWKITVEEAAEAYKTGQLTFHLHDDIEPSMGMFYAGDCLSITLDLPYTY